MAGSLSTEMQTALQRNSARAKQIQKAYQGNAAFEDPDSFELKIKNRFLEGVHSAFSEEILASLKKDLGNQQMIADALGLKDRTSISQMLRSGTIDGVRLTAALYLYGDELTLPSRECAALHGFARATSYIKAEVYQDSSIEGSMTPQDFSYLIGTLASEEWDDAIRDVNPLVARAVAVKIVESRTLNRDAGKNKRRAYRPEQCVMTLTDVQNIWGEFGIVALCSIPDCIPNSESAGEVSL